MRRKRALLAATVTLTAVALLLGLALRPAAPQSQSVPWPPRAIVVTPDRNRVNLDARNLPDAWDIDKGTNVRWFAEVGGYFYGHPVVAAGRVFVTSNNLDIQRDEAIKGDKGVMLCFDEKTGAFLWQIVHDKLPSGRVNDWPHWGILSCPAVVGDRLYYVSNRAEVVCAAVAGDPKNPGKGKVLWSFDMINRLNVFPHKRSTCSPLVVGDTVYVVTGNGIDGSYQNIPYPDAPSFLALDRHTGALRWQSNLPTVAAADLKKLGKPVYYGELVDQGKLVMRGQWSSPVYAAVNERAMVVFPGGDGWLYALTPDKGELLWKFDCNPKEARWKFGPKGDRSHIVATPVVWEGKLYVPVGDDPEFGPGVGHLWCIDVSKEPKNAARDVSPGQPDSALVWYFGGPVSAPKDGQRARHFSRSLSACAVHDGLCYAADFDGFVYCLDANTGTLHWQHDTEASIWASPLYADGKVYVANERSIMYVFEHGKKKGTPKEIEMYIDNQSGPFTSSVTATGNTLFFVTTYPTRLYAVGKK